MRNSLEKKPHNFVILKFIANFDYKKEVIFIKKNIIVTNPSKIDVKQKEQDTAKGLCYVAHFSKILRYKRVIFDRNKVAEE